MGLAVVEPAEREGVVHVGAAALGPGERVVVDLAPGEGSFTAPDGAAVVEQEQRGALGQGVESGLPSQVQRDRPATQHGRHEPGLAGHATGFAGGDGDPGVEPGGADPGQQRVEVEGDQQRGLRGGVAGGGQVLDQLAESLTAGLHVGLRHRGGLVDHSVARLASGDPGQSTGAGEVAQDGLQQVAVELRDPELAGPGAVAVVVQGQERLPVGAGLLPGEHLELVVVGQLSVHGVEHPAGGLPEPLGVHRLPGPGACSGGLAHQELLGPRHLLGGGPLGGLLGGVHDHPHLLDPQPPGGERVLGGGVLGLQQPTQPQPRSLGLPGRAEQPGQPGVGPGGRTTHVGVVGDPAGLGRRRQRQPECGGR